MHLFYGNSVMEIRNDGIAISTTELSIYGDTVQTGTITATNLNTTTTTGTSLQKDNKLVT